MLPPPGWYPDTGGSGRLRWWDGSAGSAHYADVDDDVSQSDSVIQEPAGGEPEHAPPLPTGTSTSPWLPRGTSHAVAGEFYHQEQIANLFQEHGLQITVGDGVSLHLPATLVADAGNPYDHQAVAVFVDRCHVGYLHRSEASRYHSVIAERAAGGEAITVESSQWARMFRSYDEGGRAQDEMAARVFLTLPEPDRLRSPLGLPPAPQVVLPAGSAVRVSKQEEHMDVLTRYVDPGSELPVAVTLRVVEEVRARSTAEAVEVQLERQPVGILSPTQTTNIKALVEHIGELGQVPVARAVLTGNQLKAELTLFVAKAHEVPQEWLDALGPEVAAPPES